MLGHLVKNHNTMPRHSAIIKYVQGYIPGSLLCNVYSVNFTVKPGNVVTDDKLIAAAITFQSCKILPHSIINRCAVFGSVISLQTHGCIQTKPHGHYVVFSLIPAATQPLVFCFFLKSAIFGLSTAILVRPVGTVHYSQGHL